MNKILWNLINTEEVVSIIDNVIVGTEKKKGYDKVIEEMIKELVENNLYQNRGRKSEESVGLADLSRSQEYKKVSRIG